MYIETFIWFTSLNVIQWRDYISVFKHTLMIYIIMSLPSFNIQFISIFHYNGPCDICSHISCTSSQFSLTGDIVLIHEEIIQSKHFPRSWPFVRGIHRSPVNSPHKDQWRGALMFSLICTSVNVSVNNLEVGDLRRHRAHYAVSLMYGYVLCFTVLWRG